MFFKNTHSFSQMSTKESKKNLWIGIGIGAAVLAGIGVTAGIAVALSKKKKEDVVKTDDVKPSDETEETSAVETASTTTPVVPPKSYFDVVLKSGTFLSMWDYNVSCVTSVVGQSEVFDLIPSTHVSGAHYIQNKQGKYLAVSGDQKIVFVSNTPGIDQSWFIKNPSMTSLIQNYHGGYLTKNVQQGTTLSSASGDYFTISLASSISTDTSSTTIADDMSKYKIYIFQQGASFVSISSAGWVTCTATSAGVSERFYLVPDPAAAAVGGYFVRTMDGRYLCGTSDGKLTVSATTIDGCTWVIANLGLTYGGQISSVKYRYNLVRDRADGAMTTSTKMMATSEDMLFKSTVVSSF